MSHLYSDSHIKVGPHMRALFEGSKAVGPHTRSYMCGPGRVPNAQHQYATFHCRTKPDCGALCSERARSAWIIPIAPSFDHCSTKSSWSKPTMVQISRQPLQPPKISLPRRISQRELESIQVQCALCPRSKTKTQKQPKQVGVLLQDTRARFCEDL